MLSSVQAPATAEPLPIQTSSRIQKRVRPFTALTHKHERPGSKEVLVRTELKEQQEGAAALTGAAPADYYAFRGSDSGAAAGVQGGGCCCCCCCRW